MKVLTDELLDYYAEEYFKESEHFRSQNTFDMYVAFLEREREELQLEDRIVYKIA